MYEYVVEVDDAYDILEFESLDYFRPNNEIQNLFCVFDLYCSFAVISMCAMPRCIGQLLFFFFFFFFFLGGGGGVCNINLYWWKIKW